MTSAYSRPLRVVELTTGQAAPDLTRRSVLITCDDDMAGATALRVLVTNLRRLPVILYMPGLPTDIGAGLARACADITVDAPLHLDAPSEPVTVHVHVGHNCADADVSAVPIGHGVRLRRRGHAIAPDARPASGLGHIVTAAAATAEVFKDLLGLDPSRACRLTEMDFCPVSLSSTYATVGDPPALESTALIGAGAIGTAIALILRELHATGAITVVDPETFSDENLGTYSLGSLHDASTKRDKVELLKAALPHVKVKPCKATAIKYVEQLEKTGGPWPNLVLGAVDSIEARHEIARLHAGLVLDGSTGGRAGTTLSLGEASYTGPCLRCFFPPPDAARVSVEAQISALTGLPIERLARGDEPLTAAEIEQLAPEYRRLLRRHVGKPVCGLARDLGFVTEFAPSVAFVAQQAAALVVGAVLRRIEDPELPMRYVQYDALFGSSPDMLDDRCPQPRCTCQRERELINDIRRSRGQ